MTLTRAARSLLAEPRRATKRVLAVMFLAVTVLGAQLLCGVHLEEAGHAHPATAVGQYAASALLTADGEGADGHHGEAGDHCTENRTATARADRTVSPSAELAAAPELAVQWLVADTVHAQPTVSTGVAVAAAPCLHALGISRT